MDRLNGFEGDDAGGNGEHMDEDESGGEEAAYYENLLRDDDNEEETTMFFMWANWILLLIALVTRNLRQERESSVEIQRLKWDDHCNNMVSRGLFDRTYRMDVDAFNYLVELLRNRLAVDERMARVQSAAGSIIPELRLHCAIRYLAGGTYLDIVGLVGIQPSTFYAVVWDTVAAINSCEELQLPGLPVDIEEAQIAANGFAMLSTGSVIDRCVGVMDGYLVRIETPTSSDCGNQKSYFSGHYQHHGLNIQAVADHLCRFTFFSVAGPGSMDDQTAFERTSAFKSIEDLPFSYYVIADAAYVASERLLSIFHGNDRLIPANDNWNFYASQLRIRIEMAFGIMAMKWSILQRPLRTSLRNTGQLLYAIARLHNYTINQRHDIVNDAPINNVTNPQLGYLPVTPDDALPRHRNVSEVRRHSVRRVAARGLTRPPIRR